MLHSSDSFAWLSWSMMAPVNCVNKQLHGHHYVISFRSLPMSLSTSKFIMNTRNLQRAGSTSQTEQQKFIPMDQIWHVCDVMLQLFVRIVSVIRTVDREIFADYLILLILQPLIWEIQHHEINFVNPFVAAELIIFC